MAPETLLVATILNNEPGCFANALSAACKSISPLLSVGNITSLPFSTVRPCPIHGSMLAVCSVSVIKTCSTDRDQLATMLSPSVAPAVNII